MKMFFKILGNWRKIAGIVELVKQAVADKKVTGTEAEGVLDEVIKLLVEIGVIEE